MEDHTPYPWLKQLGKQMLRGLFGKFSIWLMVQRPNPFTLALAQRMNSIWMSRQEFLPVANLVHARTPCNLLVFGVGHDSAIWQALNKDGETVYLEDNPTWMQSIAQQHPTLQIISVSYHTQVQGWQTLLHAPDQLWLELPENIVSTAWDLILVDGPAGDHPQAPGRAQSLFMASRLGASPCDVFVHDTERPLEKAFAEEYLGRNNRVSQHGRMAHFQINRRG